MFATKHMMSAATLAPPFIPVLDGEADVRHFGRWPPSSDGGIGGAGTAELVNSFPGGTTVFREF